MPLTRYQIRNEYSLADPELYKAADRDDPEALLEGVAMAGLVGVLRQLGDLAEFAAEIFHGLHEELMTTAARGHGLMARVQQLEAEFPSIEKAFLSQTNHSPFFSSSGVDWHPNLLMEQNLITRGDLPRFVMDSYEECRGPPQLFLLDKFDVAGAGACLTRYTDPSFFKVEASSEIATIEVQREKKIRKKKKGSRYRNGETPEVVQTSHTKLHDLLLQERFENGHSDPARLVKLKRRQINGSPFDLKTGKSYMEKFVLTPSPECKQVCEDSVTRSPLKLTLDSSSEPSYEIHEVSMVCPVKKSSNGGESTSSSPSEQEAMLKPLKDELSGEAVDSGVIKVLDSIVDHEMDELPPTIYKMAIQEELLVDADIKREGTVDGDHSDDMTSEVDNYMDALPTMDSEMETDEEYKAKNAPDFIDLRTQGADSDANEEQLYFQANSSDSQSIGNSSLSEGGNSSFKIGTSSFSYPDTLSNLVENTASDVEGTDKWFPSATSTENYATNVTDLPSDHPPVYAETGITESHHVVTFNVTREDKILEPVEASCSSCLTDLNPVILHSVPDTNSMANPLSGPELDEASSGSTKLGSESPHYERNGLYPTDSFVAFSDIPSQMGHDASPSDSSKSHSVNALDHEVPDMLTDAVVHVSDMSDLASEKKGSDDSMNEVLQTDSAAEHSTLTPEEEQFQCTALPVVKLDAGVPSLPDNSNVVKPDDLVSKADDAIATRERSTEISTPVVDTSESECINKHQFSDITVDASQVELDSTKLRLPCYEENVKREEIYEAPDAEKKNGFTKNVDITRDATSFEHESCSSDKQTPEDHVNLADDVTETVQAEDVAVSTAATSCVDAGEKNAFTKKVDITRGDATSFEYESCSSDKPTPEDHVNLADDVTETVLAEDMAVPTAATSGVNDEDDSDVICLSSELVCSPPRNSTEMVESFSISEDPNQTILNLDEVTSATCQSESQVKMEVTSTDWGSNSYELVSEDYQNQEVIEVHNPSLEVSNQESESKENHQSQYGEVGDSTVCSPVCYPPELGNSLEQSIEVQADQISAESMHAVDASSLLSSQTSSAGYLLGPGIPLDHTLELEYDQLDRRCLKSGEASSRPTDLQSEQIQNVHIINEERCPDPSSLKVLSSQELLLQSAYQEHNATDQATNPFDSAFPSFGVLTVPETSQVNPEAMPPLPPMQWRLGKIQPAPLDADRDMIDHSQCTFQPIETFIVDQKVQLDFPSSDREIVHPSNPFLSLPAEDSQRSQHLTTEVMGNSLLPTPPLSEMPTIDNGAQYQLDDLLSDQTQCVNPSMALLEMPDERHGHAFLPLGGESTQFSSNPFSLEPGVNATAAVNDPMPTQGLPIHLLNQSVPETGLEVKFPGQSSQNSEEEQENSSSKSAVPLNTEEEQHHHDFVTSHGLPMWPPTTLGMTPPTYEVGKINGNKIPRPRNPLIDAVAALDKSKLRKVAERVRPQLGPKLEERDSLLEQIRTKSFNLKPASVTRPSMQGVQGPKTNLKVAAILEKASAIRQALTGSDEDDDSDSWSDS
ncbi:hypothetical protein SADUNF_Sadunf16G0110500 [Salix dunnii]|uniref:Protein SCAR n=1 Tax=Salix dunnii TaxID=1413687 RepID=A0A835JDM5_9ROSI|nr:hypothetical protein SADUNF_Sadunf16G0110500 [Salix dunnii]